MRKNDGRKLSHETLEEIRIRAVKRVHAGESPEIVIQALGMNRSCIYKWLQKYEEGGIEALKSKQLFGRHPKLNGRQLHRLYKMIVEKDPQQFKFEFALWTTAMIRVLIKDKFNVRLTECSIGRILHKMGLTPQKPLYRAYQQDLKKVKKWMQKEFPDIKKEAKRCKADIYWSDEASVRSDFHNGTTWAPKGNTPIVKSTGARYSINMISAITQKGSLRFMIVEGKFNADVFIKFLQRLLVNRKNPVFLIVDSHPVHKAVKVNKFIESTKGKLKLFFLPPYSPELNPDEYVWNHLKNQDIGRHAIDGPTNFKGHVLSFFRRLQKLPKLISNYFMAPDLYYIGNS